MSVRCRAGGPAPCIDDLCHGSDTTLCGLQRGYDFCDHGNYPDFCDECSAEEDDEYGEDFAEASGFGADRAEKQP
jgi:hypothetical protein